MIHSSNTKNIVFSLILLVILSTTGTKSAMAQESASTLYVPLIGVTASADPLALPNGSGKVTYSYAVKNFLQESPLSAIEVVDDKCTPLKFIEGDDNKNDLLDHNETWRYSCSTTIDQTTQSVVTATGQANHITAKHNAYITVVVGGSDPAPIVSIVNITKIAYPLSLPEEGGDITYTYKVNNPGEVPLQDVTVTDDKCPAMSGKLGDTNGNNQVDTHEVWIYNCTTHLTETTTNTVHVEAYANGLKAVDNYTITVVVESAIEQISPNFPETGQVASSKMLVWEILLGILVLLILYFIVTKKKKFRPLRR